MNSLISEEQAVAIAKDRATRDPRGIFKLPYVESVARQSTTGHWVVKLLSSKPRPDVLGETYLYVIIDKESGSVLSVDSGGGS